jgi:NAD(P)-dependent dehydrogenase (short-subunit alcohol dehydrogenase family)
MDVTADVAVITGGGSGIGRYTTQRLVEQDVFVVVNDISSDALSEIESEFSDSQVQTVQGDASDPDTAEQLINAAKDAPGSLDLVINNVGIAGPTKSCEDITDSEFIETLEINLGSMFAVVKRAIPELRTDGGAIVNFSSISGKKPLEKRIPYTTSKMGVIGFTRTLAAELADDDIRVNAICPGSVKGPRMEAVIEGQADSRDISYQEAKEEFQSASPMNTLIDPEDVVDMVVFLSSEQAKRITGQDFNVSAGTIMH